MYVIGAFEHSLHLELAVSDLETEGFSSDRVMVISLEKLSGREPTFDTNGRADGAGTFDLAAALGTACAVLGATFGFMWPWGPIVWGLAGLAGGAAAGLLLSLLYRRKKKARTTPSPTEVVVIVHCDDPVQSIAIKKLLWARFAIGVASVDSSRPRRSRDEQDN